ncbi:ATP-dependent helicase, partial [Pseudomonas sp. BGM005]|nr:ATP-dependent helicase [Pseudomonas sp. BG5]
MYAGKMRWRTSTGDELETHLGQDNTKDVTSQAWRTALDPEGEWMPAVLSAADRRLSEIRHHVPDAGGLVLATDQTVARAYAKILHSIT